jgi:hypothetical protein
MQKPQKGDRYTHWKNKEAQYEIVGIAMSQMDSYDMKEMVIYKPLFEVDIDVEYWVRPLEDFVGEVEYSEFEKGPRFIKK